MPRFTIPDFINNRNMKAVEEEEEEEAEEEEDALPSLA
jgi:hypothetical protein